ncbi:MAG: 4'-phosphopantetheinyl transferase family protein [Pseudomonadota bacterium]
MSWRELPPLTTGVGDLLPDLPRIALVAGPVADHRCALWAAERPALEGVVAARAREFSTGRYLARCAMVDAGLRPAAIPRGGNRAPAWPPGMIGSITHAGEVAVAGAAPADAAGGLGIDLERVDRVTANLHRRLFTPAERAHLDPADRRTAGLVFSAKEAGYKAVNPRVGRFIGFQEAEVTLDPERGTFRLHYVGDHAPNAVMNDGVGYFCFFRQYVLTLFVIPA